MGDAQERALNNRLERMIEHHVVSDDANATLNGVKRLQELQLKLPVSKRVQLGWGTHFAGISAPSGGCELEALARPTVDADDAIP